MESTNQSGKSGFVVSNPEPTQPLKEHNEQAETAFGFRKSSVDDPIPTKGLSEKLEGVTFSDNTHIEANSIDVLENPDVKMSQPDHPHPESLDNEHESDSSSLFLENIGAVEEFFNFFKEEFDKVPDDDKQEFTEYCEQVFSNFINPEENEDLTFEQWVDNIRQLKAFFIREQSQLDRLGVTEPSLCELDLTEWLEIFTNQVDIEKQMKVLTVMTECFNELGMDVGPFMPAIHMYPTGNSHEFSPSNLYVEFSIAWKGQDDELSLQLPVCLNGQLGLFRNQLLFETTSAFLTACWERANPDYQAGFNVHHTRDEGDASKITVSVRKNGVPCVIRSNVAGCPYFEGSENSPVTNPRHWFKCLNECKERVDQQNIQFTTNLQEIPHGDDELDLGILKAESAGNDEEIPNVPEKVITTLLTEKLSKTAL
ncbi:hypothetical protein [Endozoicomonas elysicola]|uniref:Uncharacterized protein n=1 Tax=Endozoicomonas elysicola TaxID=305900 RepID=A0A081K9R7_9GAMM|nr:hypothetical protein [Endozoicomonas elysicola]KEI70893.1 hypothetical protein GV64_09185 [Endozoicomonas elysicola]